MNSSGRDRPVSRTGTDVLGAGVAPIRGPLTVREMRLQILDHDRTLDADSAHDWIDSSVPTVRRHGFALLLQEPAPSLRRQCYTAAAVAESALLRAPAEPTQAVAEAVRNWPRVLSRTDRGRVGWFAMSVLALVPAWARPTSGTGALAQSGSGPIASSSNGRAGLFVTDRSGATWAYQVHPAYRMDAVLDPWMTRLSAVRGRTGGKVSGFAGVVIVTPRAEGTGLHRTPESTHLLGACSVCVGLLQQRARS